MASETDPQPTSSELQDRCRRLEGKIGKQLILQQQLAEAKDQVDEELRRFTAIQRYITQVLELPTDSVDQFATLTLEAVIEIFELEIALLLGCTEQPDLFVVEGEFGWASPGGGDAGSIRAHTDLTATGEARLLTASEGKNELLLALGLDQAVVCPFADRTGKVAGMLVGGLTPDGAEYYTPISESTLPSFTVLARQAGSLRLNRQLTREIIAQNVRLANLTESYSRFVPFEFLKMLSRESIEEVGAGDAVSVNLSVLFADIRDFTKLSEELGARGIFESLNEFLAATEPLISQERGFINQYLGDAIMALFPISADTSLRCAIETSRVARTFNDSRREEGRPELRFGMGIHSGPVMLGALGGGKRLDSNVIGDTANLASRVEGLTRFYGSAALTTGETVAGLENRDAFSLREIDRVAVKGRSEPIVLFEILDCEEDNVHADRSASLARFIEGRRLYLEREFARAAECFESCLTAGSKDPVAVLFRNRCREFQECPPKPGWDGVWRWDRK